MGNRDRQPLTSLTSLTPGRRLDEVEVETEIGDGAQREETQ